MSGITRYKSIHVTLLAFFLVFILNDACFAKERYPRLVRIKIKMDADIKVKKVRGKIVPMEIRLKNKTFKLHKKHGKYGFNLQPRQMMQISPQFKDRLATSVCVLGLHRVHHLVKKDKKKAPEVIRLHKTLKLKKKASVSEPSIQFAQSLKKAVTGMFDLLVPPADAADRDLLAANTQMGAGAAVDKKYLGQMTKAYNKMLNSQAFAYPIVQPGIGGWDLLNENEQGGGGTSDDEDEQEDDKPWYDKVLEAIFAVVVMIAPVAAIIFLCSNPLTIASVLMSLAIANGAVTAASIITTTLGTVGDLLSGEPILQITDTTSFSSESGFGVSDNSWSWP